MSGITSPAALPDPASPGEVRPVAQAHITYLRGSAVADPVVS